MRRSVKFLVVFSLLTVAFSVRAAEAPDTVMGNWEGRWVGDVMGEGTVSAQIIAEGKGSYRVVISADIGEAQPVQGEMRGKVEGEKVVLKGSIDVGPENGGVHELTCEIAGGKFAGRYAGQDNQGKVELKRVLKLSPTLSAKPPEGAIVLFDGKDMSRWETRNGNPSPWKLVGDAMEVKPDSGDIHTKEQFRDFKLHVEFCTPFMPTERGQARGNSGVYLPGGNEIQVLDSFGLKPSRHDCGAFYGQAAPLVNACLPPGEWQTYDVTFIAPRFDNEEKLVKAASITVFHNGMKTYEEFHPTRAGAPSGRVLLQDHGNPVSYRNIWLVPLKAE